MTRSRSPAPGCALRRIGRIIPALFALVVFALLPLGVVHAQETLDERIDNLVRPAADWVTSLIFYPIPLGDVGVPFVLIWLILAATVRCN